MTDLIDTPGLRELLAERPELYGPGLAYQQPSWIALDREDVWRSTTDHIASAVIEKRLREYLDERIGFPPWGIARRVRDWLGSPWYVWTEAAPTIGEGDSHLAALIAACRAVEGEADVVS